MRHPDRLLSAVRPPGGVASPGLKAEIRRHWDRKASDFDEGESRVSRTPGIYEAWKGVFRQILGEGPLDILDVGSGTGELVLLFTELGHRARGIDLSREMVRIAQAKARARGISGVFRTGDAEVLPANEGSFDVVHARHLLWTLPHPRRALADWLRVLRPGGIVLVTESTWDGGRPSIPMRLKQVIARGWARLVRDEVSRPKSDCRYPGAGYLPFYGGLGPDGLGRFFAEEGLIDVRVVDLFWLRMLGRRTLPWHRRWMNPGKTGYYAAWGRRP